MNIPHTVLAFALLAATPLSALHAAPTPTTKPNIILILTDDKY